MPGTNVLAYQASETSPIIR